MISPDSSDRNRELLQDPMRKAPLVSGPGRANHRASAWQIIATTIGAIAIVTLVLYGLNNQRDDSKEGGEQTATTQITPAAPQPGGNPAQQGQSQQGNPQQPGQPTNSAPSTTGQAPHNSATNSANNNRNSAAPNRNQAPAQNAPSGQNGQPPQNSAPPASSGRQ